MQSALLDQLNNRQLSEEIRQVYYDFKFLNFFDRFGTSCFAMAALLTRILSSKGYVAVVQGCHAVIQRPDAHYHLGGQGYAKSHQIEGHVVCLVDDHYLIDFGLGNVRKNFDAHFFRAIASELHQTESILTQISLSQDTGISWHTDWISPQIEIELKAQAPYVDVLLGTYHQYQKNRIGYLIQREWHSASMLSVPLAPLSSDSMIVTRR